MSSKDLNYHIEDVLTAALKSVKKDYRIEEAIPVELEIPRDKTHGDLSTNLAFKLCGLLKQEPYKVADLIKQKLDSFKSKKEFSGAIDRIEVKAPGFINFWFAKEYLYDVLAKVEKEHSRFGRCDMGKRKMLQIEFVSANPTGPLTVAHGRQAAVGDSLANILEFAGYRVKREYYINDEGTQINILAQSIKSRYLETIGEKTVFPENGYKGDYIRDIAKEISDKHGEKYKEADLRYFTELGVSQIMKTIKKDLEDFGVKFDVWYSQGSLARGHKISSGLAFLDKKGYLYRKDGALWFKSTRLGDDKDRVVVKSDESYTYLAPDIAYHRDKFRRGFKKVINIWGPDHHGYIKRLIAAVCALGHKEDDISIIIVQLATLYRGSEVIPMSTREGQFVALRQVMSEVGRDAGRFFFMMRKVSSHLDFDLELAKKTSPDNPVYYIQYGHARAGNILKFGEEKYPHYESKKINPHLLSSEEEIEILKLLRKFPYVISAAATSLEPYFLILYLQDLASAFHSFYTKHRVVTDDAPLTFSRLKLVDCVKTVLSQGLSLLGVSAPEKM